MRTVIIGEHKLYETLVRGQLGKVGVSANDVLVISNLEERNLELAKNFNPNLIVVNCNMVLSEMPTIFKITINAHVLYLSSKIDTEFENKLLNMGVEKVLYKPFPESSLYMYFESIMGGDNIEEDVILLEEYPYELDEENDELGEEIQFDEYVPESMFVEIEKEISTPQSSITEFEIEDEDEDEDKDNGEMPLKFIQSTPVTTVKVTSTQTEKTSSSDDEEGIEDEIIISLQEDVDESEVNEVNIKLEVEHGPNENSMVTQYSEDGETYRHVETEIYIKAPINTFEATEHFPKAIDENASIYTGLYDQESSKQKSLLKRIIRKILYK